MECFMNARAEFIPLFLKGCCFKILLEIVSKKSFKHLWSQLPHQVPRFGLVCGSVQTIFMLSMCMLRRWFGKRISRKRAMFICAFLSAIPVAIGMTQREQQLFKLLIFPLFFRCVFNKMFEAELLPYNEQYGTIIGYVLSTF
jgi:hypothetical protein